MIIDSHLHVWRSDTNYPEPAVTAVSPVCDIPLELLEQYMQEFGVERAVIVQPLYPGEANDYVADCAASDPERFAAVCVVDPRQPDAAQRLEYWVRQRGCRGLRLRPIIPAEAACFGDPDTFPIWEFCQQFGVAVSVLGEPAHLATVGQLASRFMQVPIVIDHLAHPASLQPASWTALLALSAYPNVYVKISGFYAFGGPYPHAGCERLVKAIHEQFGPRRMIWGSDFPHVLLHTGYRRALLWLERTCDFISESDRQLILGGNATQLYWRG